jgi:hypothetical protein
MSATARLLAILVLGSVTIAAAAQAPPGLLTDRVVATEGRYDSPFGQPTPPGEGRDFARAKYEAMRADARTIPLEMRQAAAGRWEARFKEFLAGRGWLDFLLESARVWRDVELLLREQPAEQLAAFERYWEVTVEMEAVNEARYDAGRIPVEHFAQTQGARLEAEVRWHQAWARSGKPTGIRARANLPWPRDDGWGNVLWDPDTERLRSRARAKYEAYRSNPRDLARSEVETARLALDEHVRRTTGSLDYLLALALRLVTVQAAAMAEPADQVVLLKEEWLLRRQAEYLNQARYDAGRIPIQDVAEARQARAATELRLLDAWAKAAKTNSRPSGATIGVPPDALQEIKNWLVGTETKTIPRMKREPFLADPRHLARDRLEGAHDQAEARLKEFLAGRGTLDFLLQAARSWLDAARGATDNPAQQQAALEQYWAVLWRIDHINQARYVAGRIPIQDLLQSRYHRLEAELWLAQARAKKAP